MLDYFTEKFQVTGIQENFLVKLTQLHVNKENSLVFMQLLANSSAKCALEETSCFCIIPTKEKPDAGMDMEAAETTTIDSKSSFTNIEVFFSLLRH